MNQDSLGAQSLVGIYGRRYLGKRSSAESRKAYRRLVAKLTSLRESLHEKPGILVRSSNVWL